MGREKLVLDVEGWVLEVLIKDPWVQVCITDDKNAAHYMRISHDQAREMRDYLNESLPD